MGTHVDWTLFEKISQYFPPFFFGTLASAAFGAFAGAWVSSRAQNKKVVVAELNSIRVALLLCFSISNTFIALKKQHIRPMRHRYVEARKGYDTLKKTPWKRRGPSPLVYEFVADYLTISPVKVPTQVLEQYVFEKILLPSKGLAAAVS
jgi:hypothetical protein